jgi:thioesterase domain-containing protein
VALTNAQRAQLAARLRQGRKADPGPAPGPVIPLSQAGDVPLFAMHAVSGTVHEYALLARALDGTCRTWGIEAAGLRAGQLPGRSLDGMADRYAQAVCTTQPAGPVWLVGWSMGGVLAFETACRLSALGRNVPLVVLLDTPYRTPGSYAETEEDLAALFVADAARVLGTAAGSITATARSVPDQLDRLARRLGSGGGNLDMLRADIGRRYAVFGAHTSALARYEPQSALTASALLVSARGSIDSAPAWSRMFTGAVQAMNITGDHYDCLRNPDVQQIAAAIRQQV